MSQPNVIALEPKRKVDASTIASPAHGYTRLANQLLELLCQLDISAGSFRVLHAVIRQTVGYQKDTDRFTNSYLQSLTGLGATSVKDALHQLTARRILALQKQGIFKLIGINPCTSEWQLASGKAASCKRARLAVGLNAELGVGMSAELGDGTRAELAVGMSAELNSAQHGRGSDKVPPRNRGRAGAKTANPSRGSGHTKEESLLKKALKENQHDGSVLLVFEHWKSVMKKSRSKLTPERRAKIVARLKDYPLADLLQAIDGCACSDFHMGRQPGKPEQHNDIELIFRNGSNLERFAQMQSAPQMQGAQALLQADWTQNFVGRGGLV